MESLFPYKQDIDYTKLQTTEEGLYSITRKRDGERILSIIRYNIKNLNNKTITDGTACIGGDSIRFAMAFHHVHSIELNLANFDCLAKNINVYQLNNLTLHQGDCTFLFNWNTDVLYLDPPWGGPDYKTMNDLDLMLGNKRIDIWLNDILIRRNRPDHIVLKLPHNYNFKRLNFLINVEAIKAFRVRNYVLVIITVHLFQK